MPALLRKKKKKESWFKFLFAIVHLWLGLASSLVLFIVCLTGTILVFEEPIKHAINAEVRKVEPGPQRKSADELLALYKDQFDLAPGTITVPDAADEAVHFFAFDRQTGQRISVYADPYSGEFLGNENEAAMAFFSTMLRLHRWLLVQGPGKTIVGISTIIFLFMLLSGIILWWPGGKRDLKNGLSVKWKGNAFRINYDLHNVLGFYAMIGLFFIAATGLFFAYPAVRDGLRLALGGEIEQTQRSEGDRQVGANRQPHENKRSENNRRSQDKKSSKKETPANILEQGLAEVRKQLPYSSDIRISLPGRRSNGYRFQKYNTSNLLGARLPEYVEIDLEGNVTGTYYYNDLPADRKVTSIIKPLHTGEIMGWPSMILYFILCIIGISLPVTGFIIWLKRDAKKKKNQERKIHMTKIQMEQKPLHAEASVS